MTRLRSGTCLIMGAMAVGNGNDTVEKLMSWQTNIQVIEEEDALHFL
ncbi:hypothetical protein [Paracoccus rhizosphaerae]|uniref:Uncharacterized protein n=1 Tax=Paracoccus rhizosphaerae TaxID=1133347 RepID=A0ABV6CDP9_9RHOB|nr:hypothetical protein [Paracoccus rhizosphaerae]